MQLGPRIRFDRHTLGNLTKNVAPLAAFTPMGVVGAGLLGAVGGLARGEKLGHAALSGVENAAIGGGLASAAGHAGIGTGAHAGFGLGGGTAAPSATLSGDVPGVSTVHGGGVLASQLPATAAPPIELGGGGNPLLNAGKGVLSFAEAHPNATAGALQGVGDITTSGSKNRLLNAQANTLEKQAGETEYDFQQRKARDAALAPIWSALGTQVGRPSNVAPNPYTVGA